MEYIWIERSQDNCTNYDEVYREHKVSKPSRILKGEWFKKKKNKLKESKRTVKSWLKKEDISVILVRKGVNLPIYVSHLHPQKPCAVEDILSIDVRLKRNKTKTNTSTYEEGCKTLIKKNRD